MEHTKGTFTRSAVGFLAHALLRMTADAMVAVLGIIHAILPIVVVVFSDGDREAVKQCHINAFRIARENGMRTIVRVKLVIVDFVGLLNLGNSLHLWDFRTDVGREGGTGCCALPPALRLFGARLHISCKT